MWLWPKLGARLVPPPEDAKASVGESRSAQRAPVALNFGEALKKFVDFDETFNGFRRFARAFGNVLVSFDFRQVFSLDVSYEVILNSFF